MKTILMLVAIPIMISLLGFVWEITFSVLQFVFSRYALRTCRVCDVDNNTMKKFILVSRISVR